VTITAEAVHGGDIVRLSEEEKRALVESFEVDPRSRPPELSVCCPTRGRPDAFGAMVESAFLDPGARVEVVAYVDDDDPALDLYRSVVAGWAEVRLVVGPRQVLSGCWNDCAAVARAPLLMLGADDLRFRTWGWADVFSRTFAALPDRIAYAYGRDGHWDRVLGTHGVVSTAWVEAVGYFCPPHFGYDYNDAWLHEVAREVGRAVYLPSVLTEHMHPAFGKGAWDQTHADRARWGPQEAMDLLYGSLVVERQADARKLLTAMGDPLDGD